MSHLQNDCKFLSHVKGKLREYFKITKKRWIHAGRDRSPLLGYCSAKAHRRSSSLWSQSGRLNTIQCFLKRCNKRRYTSELINIYELLEKCDGRLLTKIKNNVNHPLYALLWKVRVIQEDKIASKSITPDKYRTF